LGATQGFPTNLPYPERLALSKQKPQPEFDLLGELQNLFFKIPLLQAMKDVPIYSKTIREYCSKKPGKKTKGPLNIHVMGKLSDIMLLKSVPVKYVDPGNPILIVQINGVKIPNVLVDLGAAINVITSKTMPTLGLRNLKPTPTVLELVDRSTVRSIGKLEDITISVDSWYYLVDILVLHTKSPAGGHSLILGRPWLATANSYIGCRSGNMVIYNGEDTKNLILYPPAEPSSSRKTTFKQNSLP